MDVSLVFAGGSKALQQFVDKGLVDKGLVDLVSQQVILFDRLGIDAEGREQQEDVYKRQDVACAKLGGCATGEARITPGFNLPATFIIHTPGPVWQGGHHHEASLLANSYRNSLQLAVANGCRTVAFPSISTGVYAYPLDQAAPLAIATIQHFLGNNSQLDRVTMVCFDARTYAARCV